MKRILLSLATLSLLSAAAFAEIKYEYNDVDKFTKEHTFKTEALTVADKVTPEKKVSYKDVSLAVQYKDSTNLVLFSFKPGKGANLALSTKSTLKVRMEDGSVITLPVVSADSDVEKKMHTWQFVADVDNTAFLKGQKATDLRIDGAKNGFDVAIPAKLQDDVHELMKVMSDAPSPIQLRDVQLSPELIKKYNRM